MNPTKLKAEWTRRLRPLVGRRITGVRYLTTDEQSALDWWGAAAVVQLDDGTLLWAATDDEGNGPGALFIQPSEAARAAGLPDAAPVL